MAQAKSEKTRIACEIDFDKGGKQQGYLRLPHSVHRSAYGWIGIPIVCIKNGDGPGVLVQAGNHGDEYEGQVVIAKLIRELKPKDIRGRLILFPMANYPAARAGTRVSPIDQGNLNRLFPGDPHGTPTQMIAHYIVSELLPRVQYVFDLHSGGSSLELIPTVDIRYSTDAKRMKGVIALARAFGAPITYIGHGTGTTMLSAQTEHLGILSFATELGGIGTVNPANVAIAEKGIRRVLKHTGVLRSNYPVEQAPPTRLTEILGDAYYIYAPDEGVFEPAVELGAEVKKGQKAGAIHFPESPDREPVDVRFPIAGIVICRRIGARVQIGDCVYHLASDVKSA
ncbi:MAG: deacylase [Rhodospirillales bacterium]|nr:deacylase [Rhodospirillales bacterium]